MVKILKASAIGAVLLSMTVTQGLAKPSKEDVEGALLLLGIAALAHHDRHYREGQAPSGAQATADFERGYRDGLHGYEFESFGSTDAYANGYEAGHVERRNQTTHRSRSESDLPNAPPAAMQGCAKVVATNYGVSAHHVSITKTKQRSADDFLVEAAVGHDHMYCEMSGSGQVIEVTNGRMP